MKENSFSSLINIEFSETVLPSLNDISMDRLSYYPHTLDNFTSMIRETFGPRAKHTVYADFKPLEQCPDPSFYIHVVEKQK